MRKRNRENPRNRRFSIPEIEEEEEEQEPNDDFSLSCPPPPFMAAGIRWGKNQLNLNIPTVARHDDEEEEEEEEEEESSSRGRRGQTILQALVPENDREKGGRFRFPAEDGTVRWASREEPWGPEWQNLVFEADEMLAQILPEYDFLTALAGKLNLDRVEDVFVQSAVESFVGQAETLAKTVGKGITDMEKFWVQHNLRKKLLDVFEENKGGAMSLIQTKIHLDDLTVEKHRLDLLKSIKDGVNGGRNSLNLIAYLIKLIQGHDVHAPEEDVADLLMITMSEVAKDLLWITENKIHKQEDSSNIMEWLAAKNQNQKIELRRIKDKLFIAFLEKGIMTPEQLATAAKVNDPVTIKKAYNLGVIIASWAVAVRWGNGPPVKWYRKDGTNLEEVDPPDASVIDPLIKQRNVVWQEQVNLLIGKNESNAVEKKDAFNILVGMILIETELKEIETAANKTKTGVVLRGHKSKQLVLESLQNLSVFFRQLEDEMSGGGVTTNVNIIKSVQVILRSILRSVDSLEAEVLLTHFIDKREENLIVSTISRIEAWVRTLKHQEDDFSSRMDNIIDQKFHSVVDQKTKIKIKQEKTPIKIDARLLIGDILLNSGQHINLLGGAIPPLIHQRIRGGRVRISVAARAAWRLRPAFQGRLRLIPTIVAGMGEAVEMIRKYFPGLVPRNVNRDAALTVLTITPGLLNLFAHLVESLIQKGDVQHARQYNPVRMFDNMMDNNLNAMKSLSSWVWGNPHAIDTGRWGAACGNRQAGQQPLQPVVNMPLNWGQLQGGIGADLRRPVGMRNIIVANEKIQAVSSSQTTTMRTPTALSQAINMISASGKIEGPPKKRQKTRSHAVRQRWVEHVTSWDAEDLRNIIMQTAGRALNVKSIF